MRDPELQLRAGPQNRVHNQVNQEQIPAGDTTENIAEIPVVQEQVILQEIPDVVDSLPPDEKFSERVYNLVHQDQLVTGEMTLSIVEHPAVQEQATVQEIPQYVAPEPVIENIAPAPAVTSAHSQQLPPVYTTTTVTTDDNLDMTGLVYSQFSSTAVELAAPHVVDSLLLLEEFTEARVQPSSSGAGCCR